MSDRNLAGAWIVTSYNYDERDQRTTGEKARFLTDYYAPVPEGLFDNELEARRWADINGTSDYSVDFWPFGVEWHERWKNGVREETDDE